MKLRVRAEFVGRIRLEDGEGSLLLEESTSQQDLSRLWQDDQLKGFVEPVPEGAPATVANAPAK